MGRGGGGLGGGGMGRRKGQRESDEKIRGSNKEGENTRKIKRNKKKKQWVTNSNMHKGKKNNNLVV